MKWKILNFSLLAALLSCSTTPTGRKQLTLVDGERMSAMGEDSFEKLKKEGKVSQNQAYNHYTRCIGEALIKAMGDNPKDWEIVVFEDESPNAFALPGKNIGVHTGMITLTQNDDQLAAVIAHEIGHVLADHGNERVSQNLVAQGGMLLANLAIGQDSQQDALILSALGVGAQVGILLPFSRKQETEADRLGLKYMAQAGFDPREASGLWQLMKQHSQGKSPPEFLSTHPSPDTRIADLSAKAPQYVAMMPAQNQRPQCAL